MKDKETKEITNYNAYALIILIFVIGFLIGYSLMDYLFL